MMTPTLGKRSRISRAASRPSISGIRMSTSAMSGFCCSTRSSELLAVGGLPDDLDALRHVEVPAKALADQRVVVRDGYPLIVTRGSLCPSCRPDSLGPSYMSATPV